MLNNLKNLPPDEQSIVEKFLKILSLVMKKKRADYDRVLPFGDYVVDRWEKAKFLGFGSETNIYDSSYVFGDVRIGEKCWIGPFTILDGAGGILEIGNHTHISAGVQIYTHDTVDQAVHHGDIRKGNVSIGSNCYLGPNVVVAMGVTIGDRVIIGANSFVNSDIPSGSKAYGTPARIVSGSEVNK